MYHISVDMEPQKQQAFPWENEEQKEEEEEVGTLLGRKSRLQANKTTAPPPPPPPAAVNGEENGGHGLAEGEIKDNHASAAAYSSHKNSHGNTSFHQFFFFLCGAIIFCYFKISQSSGDLNFLDFINEIIFILWDCVIIIFFLLSLIYCWAAYL